jgi:Holliday junction resolvase RusA-like endonuclease
MEPIAFQVLGQPQTQGSTRVIPLRAKGGGYQVDGKGRPKLIPIHAKGQQLRAWRQDVAVAARAAYDGPLLTGPIQLHLVFERPRPLGHFGTGKNANVLKQSAPPFPISKPDSVKLTRAVEDALTGVVWKDDAQVVRHVISKVWGDVFKLSVVVVTPYLPT